MDFVISKVALSVCAFMVATVLGQSLYQSSLASGMDDLAGILRQFDRILRTCTEDADNADCLYSVPYLPGGFPIALTVHPGGAVASSESSDASASTCCQLALWAWDGDELNRTEMEERERNSSPIESISGDHLLIRARQVPVDGIACTMVFIDSAG